MSISKFTKMAFVIIITATVLSACGENEELNNTSTLTPNIDNVYTMADVATHNTKENCWTVVNNNVYDITPFIALGQHKPEIVNACGIDATTVFTERHADKPQAPDTIVNYQIGKLG